MKKLITTILIIGLVLSLNFNLFLFKPKQAEALDGGGSWATAIKETVLDAIGWTVSDMILKRMMMKIQNWGLGRTNDAWRPYAITDYLGYFAGALAVGTARYIVEFEATKMEPWIKKTLVGLGFGNSYQDIREYSFYAKSTLMQDLGPSRYQSFVDSGLSMLKGGWQGWFGLMKPQNDIFGQILMADRARGNIWESYVETEKKAADVRVAVSGGYRDEVTTTETDVDACKKNCSQPSNQSCIDGCGGGYAATEQCVEDCLRNQKGDCEKECEEQKTGVSLVVKVKNIGADIHKKMDDALSADMKRIISVDEISQLIGIFFSAIGNKVISGMGRMFSPTSTYPTTVARSALQQDYSYNKSFKKEQTFENRKDVRANILSNILKSMQQLSRSIISCEEKSMMSFEDYSKNLADILGAQVEALYVGLEGINLKPDFEILDPLEAPFPVNGYSWGQIPPVKFPSKCKKMTDQLTRVGDLTIIIIDDGNPETELPPNLGLDATCRDIKSGLEPNYDIGCGQCMYDHSSLNCPAKTTGSPGPGPGPGPGPTLRVLLDDDDVDRDKDKPPIASTTLTPKQEFYNNCREWYSIKDGRNVLERCGNCLKNVEEQCGEFKDEYTEVENDTADENDNIWNTEPVLTDKEECITDKDLCYEYDVLIDHVVTPPDNNVAFYNQCLIEEKKEACYVCLKEYFVPATYCIQTRDYMARGIIKYPALVKWERTGDDKGMWIGPYDEAVGNRGGECDTNYKPDKISLSLVCRIMPDFKYKDEKLCETECTEKRMTVEQLRDTSDFRPTDGDCGSYKLPKKYGGNEPWEALNEGTMHVRGKCCAAFWKSDPDQYSICIGR